VLSFSVTTKVLQSVSSVRSWEAYLCNNNNNNNNNNKNRLEPLEQQFFLPTADDGTHLVSAEYFFLLASRTVLGAERVEALEKQTVEAIRDQLSGHLVLETDSNGRINSWDNTPRGTLFLPSNILSERGVEGVLRQCFENKTIFFQTKMYEAGGPVEICDWPVRFTGSRAWIRGWGVHCAAFCPRRRWR
jgi:hypothetical protein